ncbi:winged helix-turn-helix transcriptional regulator, partial [Hydrogenimonas sp.]
KILGLIEQDNHITIKELALRLKMSESGIKKALKKLKASGTLRRVGGAKGGHWEVSDGEI